MPTVPRYEPQVQDARTPQASIRTPTSLDTFGGGESAARVSEATQRFSGELLKFADQEKQKADQLAVLDADKRLSETTTKLLYDPVTGALNKRGKDAFDLPNTVMTEYSKQADIISKDLHNEAQRNAFKQQMVSRSVDLDRSIQAHVSGEIKSYDNATTESYLANERDAAALSYNDPERIGMAVQRQQIAIQQHAQRNGLPVEWTKLKMQEATSKTHEAVINRMLANDEDMRAKAYYDANKASFTGADATIMEKALEEGSLRGESQRQVDKIVATVPTETAAYEEAKKVQDPKLRDAIETRIAQTYSRRKEAEAEARNALYQESTNVVDQNPGTNPRFVIAPDKWAKLSLDQRNALERRAEDVPNNNKVWLDFLDLPANEMGNLNRSDFESKYWANFDKEHRTRAESMWNQAVDAKQKGNADPKLSTTLSFNDRVENTLRVSGFIPPNKKKADFEKKEATMYAQFETEAAREIENYELTQLGGKRKATGEETQKILDSMVLKKVFVNKNWFFSDPARPAVILTDEERKQAYVPFESIPPQEVQAIENIARSKNRKITKDKAGRAYAAMLAGDRKLFDAIIAE